MSDRDWFVPLRGDAPDRVFAFPHAGAGSAQLAGLAQRLAGPVRPVATWAANLPGRQARLDEPPADDLDRLVDTLATHLAKLGGGRFALFGYCGGGLLALLVAQALRDRGGPEPAVLVVASFEAPDIARLPDDVTRLPSALLWHRLAAAGGVPAALAEDERLRAVAEPAVRADFAMLSGYRHQRRPPLSCPVAVCFGTEDPAPRGAWLGWRRQTTGALWLRALPGGHWLLDDACDDIAGVLAEPFAPRSGS
jgi:medium-chain acyl-[acyl-carrier-protein] hydrolase